MSAACTTDQDLGERPDGGAFSELPGDERPGGEDMDDNTSRPANQTDTDDNGVGPDKPGSDGGDLPDAGEKAGTFHSFESASLGLFPHESGNAVVAISSEPGTVGCAVVGAIDSSPGSAGARVLVHTEDSGSDWPCPEGVYAVSSDPICLNFDGYLYDGCAVYQRWNASGELTDQVSAIGGAVNITMREQSATVWVCEIELDVRFPGGQSAIESFSYEFGPIEADEQFCVH